MIRIKINLNVKYSYGILFFGNFPNKNLVHAQVKTPKDYKVLSSNNKKLSTAKVEYYLKQGDKYFKSDDFENAKELFAVSTPKTKEQFLYRSIFEELFGKSGGSLYFCSKYSNMALLSDKIISFSIKTGTSPA